MKLFCLLVLCGLAVAQDGPAISTDEGNLKFTSEGDVVFVTGEGGNVMFSTASGQPMSLQGEKGDPGEPGMPGPLGDRGNDGLQGEKGSMGETGASGIQGPPGPNGNEGPEGPRGPPGENGTDYGMVSWNQCSWEDLNLGTDYGLLAECFINKQREETWLKVTWNGNMRITRCETCCMRWYFTINGEECTDPGPIDAVVFQSRNYHILRNSHITGACQAAGGSALGAGIKRVQFLLMDCPGFGGFVYDSYTGWNSLSKIIVEEIPPRDETFEEVKQEPPPEFVYRPHYCQFFYPTLGGEAERNLGTVAKAHFFKEHSHTVLQLTWEGNFRKKSCDDCCAKWWISVDGSPCSNYEDIVTSIYSATAYDIFAPTTVTGICFESADLPIGAGNHTIKLEVGNCDGSRIANTASGFFSSSRLIVDEIPRPRDPQVNPTAYHPQWSHCAIPELPEGTLDNGPIPALNCSINKTMSDSSLRMTFNGNLRITDCSDCCMRWFLTVDGSECVNPAPVEGVLYTINATDVNIHRGSTIAGICQETQNGSISEGEHIVVVNVGVCEGFNETVVYDAHTGLGAVSTITLLEMPPSQPPPPPLSPTFYPNWLQCVTDKPLNSNLSTPNLATSNDTSVEPTDTDTAIMTCTFTKRYNDTVLKISWDGNIALEGCSDCCMRWYITVEGEECSDPGPIDAAIRQDLTNSRFTEQFDLRRPASVVGICRGTPSFPALQSGEYTIGLEAGECAGFLETEDVLTGYNSVSRFIIEELPRQDPRCK